MNYKSYTMDLAGKPLTLEFGKYCEQAAGSVWVHLGDTVVMVNATMSEKPREGVDFFPLSVDFEEKQYSVGKIPGGFIKREGRPTEKATLTCRLIDRPLRPLFPKGMRNDVQVVATILSVDKEIPPEIPAMIGSSIALAISDIPWGGPTGSVVVGRINGQYVINPCASLEEQSEMHVTVSGTRDAVLMVEAGAKEVSEEVMLDAIMFAHEEIKKIIAFQDQIIAEIGKEKAVVPLVTTGDDVKAAVREFALEKCQWVFDTFDRQERQSREAQVKEETLTHFAEEFAGRESEIADALYYLNKEVMRKKILEQGIRPDGRKVTEVRPIWCEVGYLPAAHGSAIFTRGETQSLTTVTLGTKMDEKVKDEVLVQGTEQFVLHYNFPPFSTGEAKAARGLSRREIGHGHLAWRALKPMVPVGEENPYAVRVVSDILESNGSSSMATVCAGTLALMDAGVKLKKPVSGIAMGLISDSATGRWAVLSDILGDEDHLGDMDFKVTGTKDGITATQMDIKVDGLSYEVLAKALEQARVGRMHILGKLTECIAEPRADYRPFVPRIVQITIPQDMIGAVIGPGGKVIQDIQKTTGTTITITETDNKGVVDIFGLDKEAMDAALSRIKSIVAQPEVGDVYNGKVRSIMPFGAFVEIMPGKDALLHISEIDYKRFETMEETGLKEGDMIEVKVIGIDPKTNKLKLSHRVLIPQPEGWTEPERRPRERGDRPRRRPEHKE